MHILLVAASFLLMVFVPCMVIQQRSDEDESLSA